MFPVRSNLCVPVYASALPGSVFNRAVLRACLPGSQACLPARLRARLPGSQTCLPDRLRPCQPTGMSAHNACYTASFNNCRRYSRNLSVIDL